jgi:heme exporter protein CcmD
MGATAIMDEYAFYIWASYAVAAVVLIALALASLMSARFADRTVDKLKALSGRRARGSERKQGGGDT